VQTIPLSRPLFWVFLTPQNPPTPLHFATLDQQKLKSKPGTQKRRRLAKLRAKMIVFLFFDCLFARACALDLFAENIEWTFTWCLYPILPLKEKIKFIYLIVLKN